MRKSEIIGSTTFNIKPSSFLTSIFLLNYLLALISFLLIYQQFPIMILLTPVIIWGAYRGYSTFFVHGVVCCEKITQNKWRFKTRAGKSTIVKICPCSYRSSWLIILPYIILPTNRKQHLLLAYDSLLQSEFTAVLSSLWNQDKNQL